MTKRIVCGISNSLYNHIKEEQNRLREQERKKIKSKKRIITMVIASQSLARRIR